MHKYRKLILALFDLCVVPLTCFLAFWLGERSPLSNGIPVNLYIVLAAVTLSTLAIFTLMGLYRSLWEFASVSELMRIAAASFLSTLVGAIAYVSFDGPQPLPVCVIWFMLLTITTGGSRMSFRVFRRFRYGITWDMNPLAVFSKYHNPRKIRRVMVVGAGQAGSSAILEIGNDSGTNVVCAVDDDPSKRGMLINGIRVVGNRNDIPRLVNEFRIDEIIIAIPALRRKQQAEILEICKTTGAKLRLVPSTSELIKGRVAVQNMRDVEIEDLLGRDVVTLDTGVADIKNKTVLITGGAGSIGSELCRQISRLEPEKIVIYDLNENDMYLLRQELGEMLTIAVGSVRDTGRLRAVFAEHKPHIVFHAAAHKHVPLLEASPCEAVKNNIFGTYNTAMAAIEAKAGKFVLISTDKAVNPTNVMGATKRMAEMVVQALDERHSETLLCAVRFGNVLGSNGSVIPIFRRQIRAGGPVTLTHPDITRFFMTIPEAAQLVIQAGGLANGGEIFILDMGQPIKILDLARDMIRLSGYEPDVDIPIEFVGLRPGEKLYEELLMNEEGISSTSNQKIFVGKPFSVNFEALSGQLSRLVSAAADNDSALTLELLREFVPTFKP